MQWSCTWSTGILATRNRLDRPTRILQRASLSPSLHTLLHCTLLPVFALSIVTHDLACFHIFLKNLNNKSELYQQIQQCRPYWRELQSVEPSPSPSPSPESRIPNPKLQNQTQTHLLHSANRIGLLSVEQSMADYATIITSVLDEHDAWQSPVITFGASLAGTYCRIVSAMLWSQWVWALLFTAPSP